jgi:5-methylcytosine-specific restriction endonuclease McrA
MTDIIRKGSEIEEPKGVRCRRCFKPRTDPDAPEGLCSISCLEASSEDLSQERLRALVLQRDSGVCAECGINCVELLGEMESLSRHWNRRVYRARVHQLVRIGFPRGPVEREESLWAADHKVEKAAGGASTLAQTQTLCLACHAKKTGDFASRRANSRKPKDSQWPKRRFGR